jgi:hypothetical protein
MSVPVYHLLNVAVLIFGHFSEINGQKNSEKWAYLQNPVFGKIFKVGR